MIRRVVVGSDLPERNCNENRREHQKDSVIPAMFLREGQWKTDPEQILQSTKTGDEKRHRHQKD